MTPEELAHNYPLIEEEIAAFIPPGSPGVAEPFTDNRDVQRFFRRIGIIPQGKPGAAASQTILAAMGIISRTTGTDRRRAEAVLAAYCRSNGRLAGICATTPKCHQCPLTTGCPFFSKKPTIKQLPETERPRERLAKLGQQHLTDAELLAIIIGGGARDITAVELARSLIVRFGGFRKLAECSTVELQKVRGIGAAKAAGIKAALEIARRFNGPAATSKPGAFLNPETVFERYRHKLGAEKRETFVAMLLDAKNRLIRDLTIFQGSLTQSIVHPREAFEPAIRDSAAAVIFVHNHPSGDTTPSREDIEITKRLKQTGDVIGIRVLDHVIVSETGYTSLANEGSL